MTRFGSLRLGVLLVTVATTMLADRSLAVSRVEQPADVVIANGRVIDPESGLDAISNVRIREGRVEAISTEPLAGTVTVDASGLVVAPGFIDLHHHARLAPVPDIGVFRAMDGVTTALELEIGTADVDGWYAARNGNAVINYGVSAGHVPVRMALMGDRGDFLPSGPAANRVASTEEVGEMARRLRFGLERGAVAMGFGIAYTPAASPWELLEMFRLASQFGVSAHVHVRGSPGVAGHGLLEALALAAVTGARLHVVHAQSTGNAETAQFLSTIGAARARGLDVTTEMYPYTAGVNYIESAAHQGWESYSDEKFQSYMWPPTGERLTRETFGKYRKIGGPVIGFGNSEESVLLALTDPLAMIASDGGEAGVSPRTAGTYARILGRYVREQTVVPLGEALRRMTLAPAQRLEHRVPGMRNKGRLRVGADADVVVFDPLVVEDQATYERPQQYSTGIRYVLVNGTFVVRDGRPVPTAFPGRPVRAPTR